jgi:hypothetical protein
LFQLRKIIQCIVPLFKLPVHWTFSLLYNSYSEKSESTSFTVQRQHFSVTCPFSFLQISSATLSAHSQTSHPNLTMSTNITSAQSRSNCFSRSHAASRGPHLLQEPNTGLLDPGPPVMTRPDETTAMARKSRRQCSIIGAAFYPSIAPNSRDPTCIFIPKSDLNKEGGKNRPRIGFLGRVAKAIAPKKGYQSFSRSKTYRVDDEAAGAVTPSAPSNTPIPQSATTQTQTRGFSRTILEHRRRARSTSRMRGTFTSSGSGATDCCDCSN